MRDRGNARCRMAIGAIALCAACGDDVGDPFGGLARVSGRTPYAASCARGGQGGTSFAGLEVEPSLAIDPTNPAHLVAAWQQDRWSNGGANGIGVAVSLDGGASWAPRSLPLSRCSGGTADNGGDYDRATDPWLSVAPDGTVFLIALVFDAGAARNAMLATRSTDGGMTWNTPTVLRADDDADILNDKDSITADPEDAGRVYAVWDRVTGVTRPTEPIGTGPTWFARTTAGVWEPSRPIFDPGVDAQTIGNVIVVLPDGSLACVFNLVTHASSNAPISTVAVVRSPDKGVTWSAATPIAPMRTVGVVDPSNRVFVRTGSDLPQVAVDRASGALYAVWQDAAPTESADRISLAVSRDGGASWSAPVKVNGTTAPAFTPAVAVAADGTIGVTYYDAREALPAAFRVTAWLATSHDGGATWADEPLGEPFDLGPARLGDFYFLGDYQGLATAGNAFVPLFVAPTPDPADRTDVFVRPLR